MERVSSIKEGLYAIAPKPGIYYTNQEIVDRLKEFQSALNEGIYNKTHCENFSEREIFTHMRELAFSFGIDTLNPYFRLQDNLDHMGRTIGKYINGMAGERFARKALKLISMDKGVKILYNVCLEDNDCKAEYDAVVIAPYGMFHIEVKNWSGGVTIKQNGFLEKNQGEKVIHDLPGRMSIKEALLRECLGDLFPRQYVNMLLFPNEKTEVIDEYHRLPFFVGSGISGDIRLYAKSGTVLTDKQIEEISERIMAQHKEQKTLCDVKCDEIIEDYARLLCEIEEKAAATANLEESPVPEPSDEDQEESVAGLFKTVFTKANCTKAAKVVGATVAIAVPTYCLLRKI